MTPRELILLSPYRPPALHPLTLADEEMAAWLNAYTVLWHPLALWQAAGPPRLESPYDHETPRPGHLYAVPQFPENYLASDWDEKAQQVGAVVFKATPDRATSIANLKAALGKSGIQGSDPGPHNFADLPETAVAPFFGIGYGFLLLASLSEAMEHENLLDTGAFWKDVQQAAANCADLPALEAALHAAAQRLFKSREHLYPVPIHLLDLVLLDEQNLADPWPITVTTGQPINVVAPGAVLERLSREHPDILAELVEAIKSERAEVCGGGYVEREDSLLPVESQLWNLRKGLAVTRQLLGVDVNVYARKRFGSHPQLPTWLNQFGVSKAMLLPLDDVNMPMQSGPVMTWVTQDGQQIECFVRHPLPTDSIDTFFNLGNSFFRTTREDQTATLAFLHRHGPAQPWYTDLAQLSRFAPLLGQWTTATKYFGAAIGGEHTSSPVADDFHFDYLTGRVPHEMPAGESVGNALHGHAKSHPSPVPVSGFARHIRVRRRLDACWTLAALQRGIAGHNDPQRVDKPLQDIEDQLERCGAEIPPPEHLHRLAELEQEIAGNLTERLVSRAAQQQPGYMILNPCGFTRRLALELDGRGMPIPVADPVKALQIDGNKLFVVAEVPPLGFAWLPQAGPPGTPPPVSRMRLADERCVRNEFFEAEIDPATGGLRAIRDHKTQLNRISQRLIFRPGSVMKASQIKTTSTGPALGEIVAEGALLGAQNQVLAKFRQRFRAWLGRPILDMRIELYPEQPPAGNPWHAYFGSQFAWRDERGMLLRGVNGVGHVTTHTRPQTPDYLEIRLHRQSTTIFPCGLPFHQREGGRMLDVILAPPGETAHVFDLAIGLDREQPMQTALGLVTPAIVVPTTKGPPHIGAKGWLFHLDAPNLLLTSMRPGGHDLPDGATEPVEIVDAVMARLLECTGFSTPAELRCVRDPQRVVLLDARGKRVMDGTYTGDAAIFHVGPEGLVQVQVQFGQEFLR